MPIHHERVYILRKLSVQRPFLIDIKIHAQILARFESRQMAELVVYL